jgi:3-hydroxy-3-methylglutaryl CoA synthase
MTLVGITGYGAYIPRRRLCRKTVADAHAWLAPNLKSNGAGERTLAGWDEDTITMAVEASRHCLGPDDARARIGAVLFASTTPVFVDRLNAGIVAAALTLDDTISANDLAGTRRAGVSALLQALDSGRTRERSTLVVASERRQARPASAQELTYGDGAACIEVGADKVIARLLGRHTMTVDFIDRYRAAGARYEYLWEERWVREEGYSVFAPKIINAVLADADLLPEQIDKIIFPCSFRGLAASLVEQAGLSSERLVDDHAARCGDLGAANALFQLAATLESAKPGERILLVDFGQGGEALVLETTTQVSEFRPARSFSDQLARGVSEKNYLRYLATRDLIDWDKGPRAEKDTRTSLSVLYRNREMILGFVGARHPQTGEVQFPATRIAVGDIHNEVDLLEPYKLADRTATILSWSADRMALTPDPPNYYGMINFEGGGRLMMDFADVLGTEIKPGTHMRMVFRIKEVDGPRDYTRYFWKATPVDERL